MEDIELLGKLMIKTKKRWLICGGRCNGGAGDAWRSNGAFNDTFFLFLPGTHRTVPFEKYLSRGFIYRRMIALRDLGIKPSTVVVGTR